MNDFNVFMDELPLWSVPFGLKLLDILRFRGFHDYRYADRCQGHCSLTIAYIVLDGVPVF